MNAEELLERYASGQRQFNGANLRGVDLKGADLSEINLNQANLKGADLSDATLTKANLSSASLSRVSLTGANLCLRYVNGMGFRGIERVTGVHHTTVIYWVKQVGRHLPDAYDPEETPQVGELDELETFIGVKKTKSGSGAQ